MYKVLAILVLVLLGEVFSAKPNIVIFMADDMGSYDASFRGSNQFITKNIDALAYNGIIFDRFYTPAMCTPSRSAMMTGKYTFKIGMQNWVVQANEAYSLGLDQKIMPNYFKEAGYKTHLIGKWHLGYFQEKYTPTKRGFDSFYGYYNGFVDYWNYSYIEPAYNTKKPGYDFRRDLKTNYDVEIGTYATDLFTDEATKIIEKHNKSSDPLFLMFNHLAPHTGNDYELLQAPQEEINKFKFINNTDRQKLGAMVSKMDDSIGKVVAALDKKGMLENSIIIFYSDNRAPTTGLFQNAGSNYPLRGQKRSPWEGASRNLGCIYSPLIKKRQRVFTGYFHVVDLLPTLASAAGITVGQIDGIDHWDVLVNGANPKRSEVVTDLDNIDNYSGLIINNWKLVSGSVKAFNGKFDTFLGDVEAFPTPKNYSSLIMNSYVGKAVAKLTGKLTTGKIQDLRKKATITCNKYFNPINACNVLEKPCLFNIALDPCERRNLAEIRPDVVINMTKRLEELKAMAVPSRRTFKSDPLCDPDLHNGTWSSWIADSAF